MQTAARYLTVALPVLLVAGRGAADAGLSLAAILFVLRSAGTGDWSWLKRPWLKVALVLWLWLLVVSYFALEVRPAYSEAATWLRFVVFAAAAEDWILDRRWLRRLIVVTAVTLLLVGVDAIFQYVVGHDLLMHPKQDPYRLTGPFTHQVVGVYMMRLLFPALLGLWAWGVARPAARPAAVVLGSVVACAVFLSGERMAFLLVLLGLLATLMLWLGLKRALAFAGVAVLVGGVVFLFGRHQIAVNRQFMATLGNIEHFSESGYAHLWRSGLKVGSARPLTGVGPHNFRVACSRPGIGMPPTFSRRCNLHPHNMYIQWFAESGIPGLVGFVVLVGVWLRRLWRTGRQVNWSGWLTGPAIGVFVYLWPLGPTGGFFSNWNAVTFWLVLGWALAAARLAEQSALPDGRGHGPADAMAP